MSAVGEREIFAQQHVVEFFRDALGADEELVNTFFEIVKAQRDY